MSMDLMVRVMKLKVGNPLRKLVLLKLADNASDKGECWPSYQHIAEHCEITRRSVMNHISALCQCGFLRKEFRKGMNGNASNVYYLTPENGDISRLKDSETDSPPSEEDSPEGSEQDSLGSEANSPPSAPDSPRGSEPDSPRISHSFEPVKEPVIKQKECQADELPDDFDDPALRVLNHMNRTTGAKFQDGKTTMGFINGLLVGEYVADELILVIDHRTELWANDLKMSQYLSPKTLFSFENFEGYLPLARKWHDDGRPALNSKPVEIDTEERDIARKRFLGTSINIMQKSAIEFATRKSAATAGIKNMSPEVAKKIWDKLWQDNAQRIHDNEKINRANA
ncbi:hypothetical protein D8682_25165 [Buttiauxella sp. 3AFRM03]|nr:conserved phage C-terminal domain-containing protein [Buttiauxella sp. 3AFRM03]AYN29976.1 hypothetical protein D8682_25165 [Buttiauxella sp. 3AFRM03]